MEDRRQVCAVIGLVRDERGRILLQKRIDSHVSAAHNKWEFPGGKIEFGESPEEALERECREEVGCEVGIKRLLPVVQSKTWTRTDGKIYHTLVFCFEAKIIRGEPKPLQKVSVVCWFEEEDIFALDTLAGIDEFVNLSRKEMKNDKNIKYENA